MVIWIGEVAARLAVDEGVAIAALCRYASVTSSDHRAYRLISVTLTSRRTETGRTVDEL